MGRFFVDPNETVRITFDEGELDGEWIDLRARISHTRRQKLSVGSFEGMRDERRGKRTMLMDVSEQDARSIAAWVVRWSLSEAERGVKPDAIRGQKPTGRELESLSGPSARQILAAIKKHDEEGQAEDEIANDPLQESGPTDLDDLLTEELDDSSTDSTEFDD